MDRRRRRDVRDGGFLFFGQEGEGADSRDEKVKLVETMANTLFQSSKWAPQRELEILRFFSLTWKDTLNFFLT